MENIRSLNSSILYIIGIVLICGLPPLDTRAEAAPNMMEDEAHAKAIIKKSYEQIQGKSAITESRLILIDKEGQKKMRGLKSFRKEYADVSKTSIFFTSPPNIAGTALLTYTYKDFEKENETWLFLPETQQTRRVVAGNKTDYFMGTDLTFFDIEGRIQVENYDYKFIEKNHILDSHSAWIIEITPKAGKKDKVVEESGYLKSHQWIRKDNFIAMKGKYWLNLEGKIKYVQVVEIEEFAGVWTIKKVKIDIAKDDKKVHSTLIHNLSVSYDYPIEDEKFQSHKLSKGL